MMKIAYKFFTICITGIIWFSCATKQTDNSTGAVITDKFIEDTIMSLKEVQEKNKLIDSITDHKHGVSIIIDKQDDKLLGFYVQVGYNGNEYFETFFHFYIDSITKQISVEDFLTGEKISLDNWRNQSDESIYQNLGMELLESEKIDKLKIGLSDIEVTQLLGKPETSSKPIKWEADGLFHQAWIYKAKGVELDMCWDKSNKKEILSITVDNPSTFKTKRQIGIGSTKKQVLDAYKIEINPKAENINSIVAGSVFGGVIFKMENNYVKSIFIGAAAE